MSIEDLTIVITSFRSEKVIRECLKYIDQQCKVVNVENSDDKEYKKKIEKDFKNVHCILTGSNLGYAKGNNVGLNTVKTKYALILNPDALLLKTALTNFINVANKIKDFAVIIPYEIKDNKDSIINFTEGQEMWERSSRDFINKVILKGRANINHEILDMNDIKKGSVKGFAMFLNMNQFKDIGFFDENFFIYLEETDLAMRLIKKNKKIFKCLDIPIFHLGNKSHDFVYNNEMELSRNWHWMWSTFYFNKKHKGFVRALIMVLPKLISSFFKYLLFFILRDQEKKNIYYNRISGLTNSIAGKSSWYRPKMQK